MRILHFINLSRKYVVYNLDSYYIIPQYQFEWQL